MQQTLFTIPHWWFDGPLLWGWLVVGLVWGIALLLRKGTSEAIGFLPFYLIAAAIVWFVLPQLEVDGVNPQDPLGPMVKIGLAVRGYGVCLLLAILFGVGITLHRARRIGIDPDLIMQLAIWMIVGGIIGARLFYVIQKHDEFFQGESLKQTLLNLVDATKGGLVVYGSLIGGMFTAVIFFRKSRLPVLRTADLIAPGMVLGLAIGRIGCLMNGCCFGGICDIDGLPKIHFPAGSPPYMQQLAYGELLGMRTEPLDVNRNEELLYTRQVTHVEPGGLADQRGIRVSDLISIIGIDDQRIRFLKSRENTSVENPVSTPIRIFDSNQGIITVETADLPERAIDVHPAQIYSAIDAFLLCLLLWFFWYLLRADGQVFALMLTLHGISRFLLEMVRQDELGVFGTPLTISQWISIALVVSGIVMYGYVTTGQPRAKSLASSTWQTLH
jgi:phosphatidylglycerol:prolipoprotein diacylglycerol transferase